MAGEHAPNARLLAEETRGTILAHQHCRDQDRFLVETKAGGRTHQYNILIGGLGSQASESALRNYLDALKAAHGPAPYIVRVGSAGGMHSGVSIGDALVVEKGWDFTAATSLSHPGRRFVLPRPVLRAFVGKEKPHKYANFNLPRELSAAAERLGLTVKRGNCVSVATFGQFVMHRESGNLVPYRLEWRNAKAVRHYGALVPKIAPAAQDMESAAIAAFLHHGGYPARYGAVLGISDHVDVQGVWDPFTPLVRPFMIAQEAILQDLHAKR
ncbi:MAG: hypothetical protein Q7R45_12620 [Sulfuricaulis sp.]|nr:hypothetical protein [Sulfuricaulis sp.]